MFYLFQSVIIFAVVASNVYWQWTPNIYLPAIIGGLIALCATGLINELSASRQKRREARAKERV